MSTKKLDKFATLTSADKAGKALAVYVRRGYECIDALENRTADHDVQTIFDKILSQLSERDAAFANFNYHDRTPQISSKRSAEIDQLLAEAQAQNERLSNLINDAMGSLHGDLGKINNARQVTRNYRSGDVPEVRFRKAT